MRISMGIEWFYLTDASVVSDLERMRVCVAFACEITNVLMCMGMQFTRVHSMAFLHCY